MTQKQANQLPKIRLYVAGESPSSRAARKVLIELIREGDGIPLEAEIVDVLRKPAQALEARLLATPTLIVEDANGTQRFIGDFSGRKDLVQMLSVYRDIPNRSDTPRMSP